MEFDCEIDVLVTAAFRQVRDGKITKAPTLESYTSLALKQFRKECPSQEGQRKFIESFIRRSDPKAMRKLSSDDKARAALKFWFEVLWPNLPEVRQDPLYKRYKECGAKPVLRIGQIIHHRRFDYRGVIIGVDPVFQGTEEWYKKVARSKPPRNRPWYHVLVHKTYQTTYVAERHLELDENNEPIEHPMISQFFDRYENGRYVKTKDQ